jgi:dipeptidase D
MSPSHRVLQWLKDFANERKLAWQQDAVGNLVIKRTGTGGGQNAPAVVIQVCEKCRSTAEQPV